MNRSDTHIEPLISPDQFVGLEGVTHFCTGGEAPWLKAQEVVYAEFAPFEECGTRWAGGDLRARRTL